MKRGDAFFIYERRNIKRKKSMRIFNSSINWLLVSIDWMSKIIDHPGLVWKDWIESRH